MDIPTTSKEAISRLQNYLPELPLSRLQALEFLEVKLNVYRLLHLYQVFFPEQFAASRASTISVGEGHSEGECEFISLLDEHCFPRERTRTKWTSRF